MYFYTVGPIDCGWNSLPKASTTLQSIEVEGFEDEGFFQDPLNVAQMLKERIRLANFLAKCLAFGRTKGWEGDFQQEPRMLYLPDGDGGFSCGFVWKQTNNGQVFIASPVELPYLDKDAWEKGEYVNLDKFNLQVINPEEMGNREGMTLLVAKDTEMSDRFNAVKERCKIEGIVGRYVDLVPCGTTYLKGKCCFCLDKYGKDLASKDSLAVTPAKGIFYCFFCHAGGDVVAFVALKNGISQVNALQLLESLRDDELTGKVDIK